VGLHGLLTSQRNGNAGWFCSRSSLGVGTGSEVGVPGYMGKNMVPAVSSVDLREG
jgi:hypothetical protein